VIRFYNYLFACAYVNAERQWKTANGASFLALMAVTLTVMLNVGALLVTIPILLGLPHLSLHSDKNLGAPIVVVLASLCWLAFARNGKGVCLARELKEKGEDSIIKCQLVTFGALFGSIALFFIPMFLAVAIHPRPNSTTLHPSDRPLLSSPYR